MREILLTFYYLKHTTVSIVLYALLHHFSYRLYLFAHYTQTRKFMSIIYYSASLYAINTMYLGIVGKRHARHYDVTIVNVDSALHRVVCT